MGASINTPSTMGNICSDIFEASILDFICASPLSIWPLNRALSCTYHRRLALMLLYAFGASLFAFVGALAFGVVGVFSWPHGLCSLPRNAGLQGLAVKEFIALAMS